MLTEATLLAKRADALHDIAAINRKVPKSITQGLGELTADLRYLRDAIHDAALDPTDETALPRFSR